MLTYSLALICCAVGTFLIRYLPLRWLRGDQLQRLPRPLFAFLNALGPAAMISLCLTSILPELKLHADWQSVVAVAGGLGTIYGIRCCYAGIIVPTFCGTAVYGLLNFWLT